MLWRIVVSIFHELNTVKPSISFKKSKKPFCLFSSAALERFLPSARRATGNCRSLPAAVDEDCQIKKFERALSIKRDVKEGNMLSSLSLY